MKSENSQSRIHYFDYSSIYVIYRERTIQACAFILIAAAWVEPESIYPLLGATLDSYLTTLPFMLLSILIAASIKATGAHSSVAKVLNGRGAVLTAALFGALSPFCSCGVIPLIAGILAAGAPLAPVMAFWLASPIVDPEMLILTWNMLGSTIALAKLSAAISIGLLGGYSVKILQARGHMQYPLRQELALSSNSDCSADVDPCKQSDAQAINWRFWQDAKRRQTFIQEFFSMSLFLSKWLILAFLLEEVMLRWVPMESMVAELNNVGYGAIPLSAMLGVPAYLNGYAAIPLVRSLLDSGLLPGAALSFMVAGGVTSIPAVVAVWGLVHRSTFVIYLGVAALGSVAVGLIFQLIVA